MSMKNWSTGDRSTGDGSTGDWSTGYGSTGYGSTGDWSTGYGSTGYGSTGNGSTGNGSTGNWSTGNWSTGHFSSVDYDGFSAFNKPCNPQVWDDAIKPNFLFFGLVEWVESKDMTDKEKLNNSSHITTGGYQKTYEYKEAWRRSWDKTSYEDRELVLSLPNFDADIFLEISGIDVRKELCEGKTVEISNESARALGLIV